MRLSEAIRLGAMMKPQCRYKVWSSDGKTCAAGSALDAIGMLNRNSASWDLCEHFPNFANLNVRCPVHPHSPMKVWACITALNDYHRWTREAIADWVATVEPAEDAVTEAVDQEAVTA